MVLGCRSKQGHTTDINILNCVIEGHVRIGHRLLERIQIADHEINVLVAELLHVNAIAGNVTCQNAAVHGRVQRLNTAT